MQRTGPPSSSTPPAISFRANIWIIIPIGTLIAALLAANFLFLNYVHVFSSILWTGTDIFMAFLLDPVLRNVSLSTRKEIITWLMPKILFLCQLSQQLLQLQNIHHQMEFQSAVQLA